MTVQNAEQILQENIALRKEILLLKEERHIRFEWVCTNRFYAANARCAHNSVEQEASCQDDRGINAVSRRFSPTLTG